MVSVGITNPFGHGQEEGGNGQVGVRVGVRRPHLETEREGVGGSDHPDQHGPVTRGGRGITPQRGDRADRGFEPGLQPLKSGQGVGHEGVDVGPILQQPHESAVTPGGEKALLPHRGKEVDPPPALQEEAHPDMAMLPRTGHSFHGLSREGRFQTTLSEDLPNQTPGEDVVVRGGEGIGKTPIDFQLLHHIVQGPSLGHPGLDAADLLMPHLRFQAVASEKEENLLQTAPYLAFDPFPVGLLQSLREGEILRADPGRWGPHPELQLRSEGEVEVVDLRLPDFESLQKTFVLNKERKEGSAQMVLGLPHHRP